MPTGCDFSHCESCLVFMSRYYPGIPVCWCRSRPLLSRQHVVPEETRSQMWWVPIGTRVARVWERAVNATRHE
jgi:hypothetical protein